ncbi:MAG: hypothetical protein JKY81_01685 [Colwellia sp.]|nr:hypothetical protein [Colwellia sp.]
MNKFEEINMRFKQQGIKAVIVAVILGIVLITGVVTVIGTIARFIVSLF